MYQVILINDEKRNKDYFYSYVESYNMSLGNIQTEKLPPYTDINKQRACYWTGSDWTYDEDKYNEIVTKQNEEESKSKSNLSNSEKLNIFASLINVKDAPEYDGFVLPNKYGHKWSNTVSLDNGVPTIDWTLIKSDEQVDKDGSSSTMAIPWNYGELVEKGLYYNVGGAIATALRDGVPKNYTDSKTFSFRLT